MVPSLPFSILAGRLRVTRIDDVHPAPDSVGIAFRLRKVVQNNVVGNLLDQSRAEHGRWRIRNITFPRRSSRAKFGCQQNTAIRARKIPR